MEHSFNQIVARQQRKGIATIINGVHVIPEVLKNFAGNNNIIFINLYVTNEREIYQRIFNRDSASYMLEQIPFIFQTNNDLYLSTQKLTFEFDNIFNVNVTELSVENTIKNNGMYKSINYTRCVIHRLHFKYIWTDFFYAHKKHTLSQHFSCC